MAFKLFALIALAAAVQASQLEPFGYDHLGYLSSPLAVQYLEPAPLTTKITRVPIIEPVTKTIVSPAPAHYDFGYSVSDPYAAHHQSRVESRRGDVVKGSYSVLDADGTKRIVDYNATPLGGFRAIVRKEPGVLPVAPLLPAYV